MSLVDTEVRAKQLQTSCALESMANTFATYVLDNTKQNPAKLKMSGSQLIEAPHISKSVLYSDYQDKMVPRAQYTTQLLTCANKPERIGLVRAEQGRLFGLCDHNPNYFGIALETYEPVHVGTETLPSCIITSFAFETRKKDCLRVFRFDYAPRRGLGRIVGTWKSADFQEIITSDAFDGLRTGFGW